MKYRLLALDIDGTILNSNEELTPRTRRAIIKAQEQGITVILATGRRLTTTLPWARALGLNGLLAVHNGAVIFDQAKNEIVSQQGIDLAAAQATVDKLDELSLNYVIYTGESSGERVIAPVGSWREPENLLIRYLGENAEFVEMSPLKSPPVRISIIDRWERVDPLFEELQELYGAKYNAMYFGAERDTWRGIEIIPAQCHKGWGLAFIAERLGIAQGEIVAIGDNVNDLEMIAWAGLGIAMENGSKVLKTKADQITKSHDEDGVAHSIEELFF